MDKIEQNLIEIYFYKNSIVQLLEKREEKLIWNVINTHKRLLK